MKKLKLNYSELTVYPFIGKVQTILQSIAANVAYYPAPNPALADMQTMLDNLLTAAVAAESGDHQKIAARNSYREILALNLEVLGNYCENMAAGDLEKLIASGYTVAKDPAPIGVLSPVSGLEATYTGVSGKASLKWKSVYGAKTYVVYGRPVAEPQESFAQIGIATRVRFSAEGLAAGTWEFRVVAIGTAGESAPSVIASAVIG